MLIATVDVSKVGVIIRGRMNESRNKPDKKSGIKPQDAKVPRWQLDMALTIALAPVVASALRVWMYSGGDVSLFLTLLSTLNIVSVLVGTSLVLAPGVLALGLTILFTDREAVSWLNKRMSATPWLSRILFPVVFFVSVYTLSWTSLLMLAGVCVAFATFLIIRRGVRNRRSRKGRNRSKQDYAGPDSIVTIIAVLTMMLMTPNTMWLPLEKLTVEKQIVTGYVLDVSSEWTTILASDRELHIVPSAQVTTRDVCAWRGKDTLALLVQKGGLKKAPDCQ